jgi:hypothetical protein
MLRKSLFAVALVIPAIALSTTTYAGQAYQGGPKSGLTKATQSQAVGQFQPNKPYAQAVEERKGRHVYQGGPWTNIPMATH